MNIRTYFDKIEEYNNEFVVYFGQPHDGDGIPEEKRLVIVNADENAVQAARNMNPANFSDGIIFIIQSDNNINKKNIGAIQKHVVYLYYKHVFFPKYSLATADSCGVREINVPEIVREISSLKNLPYLLRYPIVDKLDALQLKKPVLLLLPGPSLKKIIPHLKELAKRCFVICVSRTLLFCLENGIEPDFVVQLDTFLVQQHFYPADQKFPNTILVNLSIAPVYRYAHNFRGVFLMDSFNLSVLPNEFRLRESHVSSLMACLGLAECLHAPQAFVVGADLSFSNISNPYYNNKDEKFIEDDAGNKNGLIVINGEEIELSDTNGRKICTKMRYLATAVEAELYAEDIQKTTETSFFNLSGQGILSEEWFPGVDVNAVLNLPELDRPSIFKPIDKVLLQPEDVNLIKLKVDLIKLVETLKSNERYLEYCQESKKVDEVQTHPVFMFVKNIRDYFVPDDDDERLKVAITLINKWKRAAQEGKKLVQAYIMRKRGKTIPFLCEKNEKDDLLKNMESLFSGWKWKFISIWNMSTPSGDRKEMLAYTKLYGWLNSQHIVFVSKEAMREYDYFFDVYPMDNVLCLDDLFYG